LKTQRQGGGGLETARLSEVFAASKLRLPGAGLQDSQVGPI